jgi:hypothetical protein
LHSTKHFEPAVTEGWLSMRKIRILFIIFVGVVLVIILPRCYSSYQYSGDGHLIDNGPLAGTDRYVLDLGRLTLNKQSTFEYRLENLPAVNFVIGIEIQTHHLAIFEDKSLRPMVLIELLGPKGELLMREQSSLDIWTWNIPKQTDKAFVYRGEPEGKPPSTFFTPVAGKKYKLRLGVVQPDYSNTEYTARLLAKSGGWK